MNIVEIAAGSDDFNILVQALSTAGLVETIQNANDITVFAPTDAAFTALAVDLGFDGDQSDEDAVFAFIAGALTALDPDGDPLPLLTQILTYHVSPGAKDSAAVTALTNIGTLEGTEIVRDGLVLQDQEPDVADPTLETLDIPADNGIIHTIDRVLLPIDIPGNTNIVDIALASDDLNILVRALSTAGLVETIQNATDITVFAPTDAAFAQTAVDLGFTGEVTDEDAVFNFIVAALTGLAEDDNPLPLLTQILTYHVAGEVLDAAAVTAADSIPTLQGGAITPAVPVLGDLEPDLLDPALSLDPGITATLNIQAGNGIVHLIDRVLLPIDIPGNDVPSITGLVAASGDAPDDNLGDFDLLLAAVQTAGLAGVLDTEGLDATVFAPTDAAFVALAQALGFDGSDEAGALGFIVEALTALGNGDPIPLLTEILTYHVSPGTKQSQQVLAATEFETLQGGTLVRDGLVLQDAEPGLTDPNLVPEALDILASNGIVHAIDAVLLPVALPSSNGAGQPLVLIGTEGRDRLAGEDDNDLLIQKGAGDLLLGGGGADIFALADAGVRSKIIDFEEGADLIDISAWGVTSVGELVVTQRGEGSLLVGSGKNGVVIQAADGAIAVAALTDASFVFASSSGGETITGTDGRDRLEGTAGDDTIDGGLGRDFLTGNGGNDVFVAGGDVFDVILDFTENADQIDLTEWIITDLLGAAPDEAYFGQLQFTQFKAGLVEIAFLDEFGDVANSVRVQAADRQITQADFDADDFIFS